MRTIRTLINNDNIIKLLNEKGVKDTKSVLNEINKTVDSIIKQYTTESKKEILEHPTPFLVAYPNVDKQTLPQWVVDNIDEAVVIGNAKQTVVVPDGRRYQLNNKLNHLSGGEWIFFTNSVLNTRYLTKGEDSCAHNIRKIHPTPKPPPLMRDIIEFFTKENEIVLDYFMGVGGSLLGAAMCGRKAIGIELNNVYVEAYKQAAELMDLEIQPTIVGDSLKILKESLDLKELLNDKPVSLVLIDPPYANMMSKSKTGGDMNVYGAVATPFTDLASDLGNMDIPEFLEKLKESVQLSLKYLKVKGYIVVFIKDLQPNKKDVNLLHSDIINRLNEIENVQYKGLRIWSDQTAKLFPYGYPFSFVANQIHQYILIFRKEK